MFLFRRGIVQFTFINIALFILNYSIVIANDFRVAKYGGEFLSLGVGGRALGMGGAFSATANDVTAGYWNPAGLIHVKFPQVMLMHTEQFDGIIKYDYGGFALPIGNERSIGISLIRVGIDDILLTQRLQYSDLKLGEIDQGIPNRPIVDGTISDAEYAFLLSYSIQRKKNLSFGANIKIIHKGIGDFSAWGLGFDIATLFKPVGNLHIGINLQDITTTVLAWDNGTREVIVPTIKTGLAYPLYIPFISGTLSSAVDFDIRFEGRNFGAQLATGPLSLDSHLGWEYQFQDIFSIRLGSDIGRFSAGAGIKLPKFQFDYAFVGHNELGDTHRISAKLSFIDLTKNNH